jgi:splicing factor U2AF subunit
VKDSGTTFSKGYCFFEYVIQGVTDVAIQGLNGMQLGDKKLVVQRASVGAAKIITGDGSEMIAMPEMPVTNTPMPINIPGLQVAGTAQTATEILCLMNMVTKEELEDDEEFEGGRNCMHMFLLGDAWALYSICVCGVCVCRYYGRCA